VQTVSLEVGTEGWEGLGDVAQSLRVSGRSHDNDVTYRSVIEGSRLAKYFSMKPLKVRFKLSNCAAQESNCSALSAQFGDGANGKSRDGGTLLGWLLIFSSEVATAESEVR